MSGGGVSGENFDFRAAQAFFKNIDAAQKQEGQTSSVKKPLASRTSTPITAPGKKSVSPQEAPFARTRAIATAAATNQLVIGQAGQIRMAPSPQPKVAPSRPPPPPPASKPEITTQPAAANTASTLSVKDIAKMFDDVELPTLPTHSSTTQHAAPPASKSIPAQPQFQDIGLDMDAEIKQLNTMIEAKDGTQHEGYMINPSVIENLESANKASSTSDQKSASAKLPPPPKEQPPTDHSIPADLPPPPKAEAPAQPTVMAKAEAPKEKEEASGKNELSEDDLVGDDSDDDSVVIESPGTYSNEPTSTQPLSTGKASQSGAPKEAMMEEVHSQSPSQESQPGVTKVSIQGGAETKSLTMKELDENIQKLKTCKSDNEQQAILFKLQPGQRKQLSQFIGVQIRLLGQQESKARGSQKLEAGQEKMNLHTLAAKVAVNLAKLEEIPASSLESEELRKAEHMQLSDVVQYICDPFLFNTCENSTFRDYRSQGLTNETLIDRFVFGYSGFTDIKKVVDVVFDKLQQPQTQETQQNLLKILRELVSDAEKNPGLKAEQKQEITEHVAELAKKLLANDKLKFNNADAALINELAKPAKKENVEPAPAVEIKPITLTLATITQPGKKPPAMVQDFAKMLTSIQNNTYQSIERSEFFSETKPNLDRSISLFNKINEFVQVAILANNQEDILPMIEFFLDAQQELLNQGNYQGAYAIFCGFNGAAISRLDVFKNLGDRQEQYNKMAYIFNPSGNFKNLQPLMKKRQENGENFLPLLSSTLAHLAGAGENPNPPRDLRDKDYVNPYKMLMYGKIISSACVSQAEKHREADFHYSGAQDELLGVKYDEEGLYAKSQQFQPPSSK